MSFIKLFQVVLRNFRSHKHWYNQSYLHNFCKLYLDRQLASIITNTEIKWSSLVLNGNKFQITKPKYLKDFLPLKMKFTEGITSSGLDLKLVILPLLTNKSFNLFPEIAWRVFQTSVKSRWIFWWWIQEELFTTSTSSNVEIWSS